MGILVAALLAIGWGYTMGRSISNPFLACAAGGTGGYAIAAIFQYFGFL